MAVFCPLKNGPVLYLDCNECHDKICKNRDIFYCLVVGSRSFNNYDLMSNSLDYFLQNQKQVVIVSGEAQGADQMSKRYAKEKGYRYVGFPADWSMGRYAGYERNKKMHRYITHFPKRGVVAFWDGVSKGTAHSFSLAKEYNNPIKGIRF